MTDELDDPIPVNQSAGSPTDGPHSSPPSAEMPSPAVEDGDSAVAGKGQPRKRRKPKIMQFAQHHTPDGDPQPIVLDVPEAEEPAKRRRGKKITPDQAVKLVQIPFHGAAQITGFAMWEVDASECDWFKDELAQVIEEMSKQSGGKLAHYMPYATVIAGLAFLGVPRAIGYGEMVKRVRDAKAKEVLNGQPMSHPPDVPAENGFDQVQAEKLIAAMMGQ